MKGEINIWIWNWTNYLFKIGFPITAFPEKKGNELPKRLSVLFLTKSNLYRSIGLGDLIDLCSKMNWDPESRKCASVTDFIYEKY